MTSFGDDVHAVLATVGGLLVTSLAIRNLLPRVGIFLLCEVLVPFYYNIHVDVEYRKYFKFLFMNRIPSPQMYPHEATEQEYLVKTRPMTTSSVTA